MDTGPGNFGPQTEASLRRFQRARGVAPIGIYGPQTRAAFARLGARIGTPHRNPYLAQFQRALLRLRLPLAWASKRPALAVHPARVELEPACEEPQQHRLRALPVPAEHLEHVLPRGPLREHGPVRAQAMGGFRYIKARYGAPAGAWNFWRTHRWYQVGPPKGTTAGRAPGVRTSSARARRRRPRRSTPGPAGRRAPWPASARRSTPWPPRG